MAHTDGAYTRFLDVKPVVSPAEDVSLWQDNPYAITYKCPALERASEGTIFNVLVIMQNISLIQYFFTVT